MSGVKRRKDVLFWQEGCEKFNCQASYCRKSEEEAIISYTTIAVRKWACALAQHRFRPPSLSSFLSLPPSATYLHILTICPHVVGRGSGTVQGRPILLVQWLCCITALMWQNLTVRMFIDTFPFSTISLVLNRAEHVVGRIPFES